MALSRLLHDIADCRVCEPPCPAGCRPLVQIGRKARVLIIGQAPGRRAHGSGIPWNDPSGDRLREWLGVDRTVFYDRQRIALMPMGFCYPGTGSGGDHPPRPECAPRWHERLLALMPQVACTILIGRYAMERYAADVTGTTLAERVLAIRARCDDRILLPHPSPRNQRWLRQHRWFVETVLPDLRRRVAEVLR